MSYLLPPIDLSLVGVGGTAIMNVPNQGAGGVLLLVNDSPFTIQATFSDGTNRYVYAWWSNTFPLTGVEITISLAVLSGSVTNAPSTSIYGEVFKPGEPLNGNYPQSLNRFNLNTGSGGGSTSSPLVNGMAYQGPMDSGTVQLYNLDYTNVGLVDDGTQYSLPYYVGMYSSGSYYQFPEYLNQRYHTITGAVCTYDTNLTWSNTSTTEYNGWCGTNAGGIHMVTNLGLPGPGTFPKMRYDYFLGPNQCKVGTDMIVTFTFDASNMWHHTGSSMTMTWLFGGLGYLTLAYSSAATGSYTVTSAVFTPYGTSASYTLPITGTITTTTILVLRLKMVLNNPGYTLYFGYSFGSTTLPSFVANWTVSASAVVSFACEITSFALATVYMPWFVGSSATIYSPTAEYFGSHSTIGRPPIVQINYQ